MSFSLGIRFLDKYILTASSSYKSNPSFITGSPNRTLGRAADVHPHPLLTLSIVTVPPFFIICSMALGSKIIFAIVLSLIDYYIIPDF